jgi:hypothetical protein
MRTTKIFLGFAAMVMGMAAGRAVEAGVGSAPDDEGVNHDEIAAQPVGSVIPSARMLGIKKPDGDCGECARPILCVAECGGAILRSGCCPCPDGTRDSATCGDSEL